MASVLYGDQASCPRGLTFDDVVIRPQISNIKSRDDVNTKTRFTRRFSIKTPIISSPMDTVTSVVMASTLHHNFGAVGAMHRFMDSFGRCECIRLLRKAVGKHAVVVGTIGLNEPEYFVDNLTSAGANVLLVDVANGQSTILADYVKKLVKRYPKVDIIAGSVVTGYGVKLLADAGVAAIRCGLGSGSLCETRIRTGVGMPQVTALMECVQDAEKYGLPVISDGGIRVPGDMCKAIAIGASSVMIGSLFAGTNEAPVDDEYVGPWPGKSVKRYRGSASAEVKLSIGKPDKYVEGASTTISTKGSVIRIVDDLLDGLRSCMSYVNARTIEQLRTNSQLYIVSNAGLIEGRPHLLERL
jgi:IMP dehydrogenase